MSCRGSENRFDGSGGFQASSRHGTCDNQVAARSHHYDSFSGISE